MPKIKNWIINLLRTVLYLNDRHLDWQLARHDRQARLKTVRALNDHDLAAQLQIKATQLTHELALLKTEQSTKLAMLEIRCKQDIQDYKDYLQALTQLKQAIQNRYPQLPASFAYTIHHHAKQLLNQMWEEDDFQKKRQLEMQLIQLMTAINEDAGHSLEEHPETPILPARTLDLLQLRNGLNTPVKADGSGFLQ